MVIFCPIGDCRKCILWSGRNYINKETALKNTAIYPDETAEPEGQADEGGELTVISDGGELTVAVNGEKVEFQLIIDENERTQIPIRAVAKALDCAVDRSGENSDCNNNKG